MTDDRERAWSDIHDLLLPGWRVPTTALHDPATGRRGVTAIGAKRVGRRGPPPDVLIGNGEDEMSALVDLMLKLRVLPWSDRVRRRLPESGSAW